MGLYKINDFDSERVKIDKIRKIIDHLNKRMKLIETTYQKSTQNGSGESGAGLSVHASSVHSDAYFSGDDVADYLDIADLPEFEGELAEDDQVIIYDSSQELVCKMSIKKLKAYLKRKS